MGALINGGDWHSGVREERERIPVAFGPCFISFSKEMRFLKPLSCLWASSHICSHPFPYCPKHRQISPTASFQRQQFPRIFSRRQPVTGRRAASPGCPHPREVAWSHPWPGSRSPGCFSPAKEPHQPVSALSWASANHETQNCRKPGFTTLEVGYRGAHLDPIACTAWVSTATETRSAPQAGGSFPTPANQTLG